jgi:hypothetical protein
MDLDVTKIKWVHVTTVQHILDVRVNAMTMRTDNHTRAGCDNTITKGEPKQKNRRIVKENGETD